MNCPFAEDVSAYFDGEVTAEERARVEAHLETCASCRAMLADFRDLRAAFHPVVPLWRRRVAIPLPVAAVLALALCLAPFVAFRRGGVRAPVPSAPPAKSDVLARYDGGGRAVIAVCNQEPAR